MFRTLGFILSTLGSVPSNVFTVVLGTLNTFDGTDPKVDRVKPKVRSAIFPQCTEDNRDFIEVIFASRDDVRSTHSQNN